MADEFVPVALADEEEEFTPVALADEESDFTPVGFAEDEQPIDTRRVRGEAFKMLNDAQRLSPARQREVADPNSGVVGETLKTGKGVLGGLAEAAGETLSDIMSGNPLGKPNPETMAGAFVAKSARESGDLKNYLGTLPDGAERSTVDGFVKFFEGNGITDGKQMMEVLKDSIRENTWDPTTDDDARVLSDGTLRVNPKFVALPDAQAGIDAILAAPVDDETWQREVENFKAARKTAAAALDTKTKAFDEDYRTYAAAQAEKGITDPEQVFFGWPGLDRNFIESSWDVVRDTVAEAGRGTANTARGVVAGVGEKLGLEGLVEGVGRDMLASAEKSGFVKEIAAARDQEGVIVSTGKDLGNTVLQMVPMFAGAGAGRLIAGAAEAGTAKRILGNIAAGTSVYGYAGAQGYSSVMQQALDSAQRDAEMQGRELTGDEINATVEKFQGAALANGIQTAVLARLLPEGAEKAALNGLAAQAGQMTGRDVFAAMRAKYGQDGVRAAVMAAKPEIKEFVKQAYRAGKVGFKDEAIEEGVNQFLEGTIVKMSGADPDKTWDQIGQETWTGAWMGGVIGGGLPVATKTLAKTDPADLAARQLAAGAQTAAPTSAEASMEPLDNETTSLEETPAPESAEITPRLSGEPVVPPAVGQEAPTEGVTMGDAPAAPEGRVQPDSAGAAPQVTPPTDETTPLPLEPAAPSVAPAAEEAGVPAAGVTVRDRVADEYEDMEVEAKKVLKDMVNSGVLRGLEVDTPGGKLLVTKPTTADSKDAVFRVTKISDDGTPSGHIEVSDADWTAFKKNPDSSRFTELGDLYRAAQMQARPDIYMAAEETIGVGESRGEFTYRLRNRDVAPGAYPKQDFIRSEGRDVTYSSPLSRKDLDSYELVPVGAKRVESAPKTEAPAFTEASLDKAREALLTLAESEPKGKPRSKKNQGAVQDALDKAYPGLWEALGDAGFGFTVEYRDDINSFSLENLRDTTVAGSLNAAWVTPVKAVEIARKIKDKTETPQPAAAEPATPRPYSPAALKDTFDLSDEQSVAVDALVQAMGLDTSRIQLKRGGNPGGGALNMANAQETAGSFEQLRETGDFLLRGLKDPDVSTAIHEIAHAGRRSLLDRTIPAENRAGITDEDIAITEAWAGAKDGNWTVAAEEKFARGLERYLRDGKAPTTALQGVFDKIGAWLRGIYANVTGSAIDIEISDTMRAVFDKLVSRGLAATTETEQLVALDAQIEQDLEPPIPAPEFNAAPLPPDQSPTSIKHAQVDADRERMGLPPRFRRPPYTDQAAWDRAIAAEDAHRGPGTAGSKLLERLIREGPRALTKDESALLLHEKLLREDAVDTAQSALNAAGADGRLDLQSAVKAAMESFRNLADYVDAAGSASGLSLQARKMMVNRDYSLASVAREMHAAKNLNAKEPVPWTSADQAKAAEVAKKLQETQARLDTVLEENTELTAAVERLTREVEQAQAKLRTPTQDTKVRKLVKEKLDPLVAEARARLEARGRIRPSLESDKMLSGLDPEAAQDIKDMAIVGAGWLIDKALTVQEFGAKLIATFGDWAKDHIDAVFAKSNSLFAETAASVSGGSAPTPQQVKDSIDPETELEKGDVWDLARAHVIAGARGRNVLENVFNDLSPLFPDLTRDRVAELFTDYGKTTRPSQNETAKELQRVKSLERIALKLADVRAKQMPKRTGFQRGEQDAEIRELEKQFREEYRALEEEMRAKGIPFEDSERRLKTALGAVKRRMLNEIEELQRAIDAEQPRNAAVRQPVEYDQAAIDLRARLEAKRAEYDAMFSKETTREKRVAAAIKTLDRQIAEEAKMLADGVLKKAKGEQITSPEIETRREQLRAMRQNRRDLYAAQNPGEAEADALAAAKKAAQKAIERLGAAVTSGDVAVKKKDPAYTPDAELTALIEARETLSDMVAEMRRALPATPAQEAAREKRMLAAAEKTLGDLDAKLAAGDLSVRAPRTAAAVPASVMAVREKIKSANRQLDARRREAGVGPYSMDAKIQRQLGNVNKRLAEYQRRIREKDFSKKVAAKPVTSAEILDVEFEAAKAKAEYQEMLNEFKLANATFGKKLGYYAFSTNNLLKLLTLGFDIGVLTRQLGTTYQSLVRDLGMFAPTAEGAKRRADGSYIARTIRTGVQAFMDPRKELDIYKAVSTRPNAGWDKAAGLIFGAPFDDQAGTREDVPTANFIETIPWWVWPAIAGAKIALVGVSPPVAIALIGTSLVQKKLLIALDRAQRAMTNQSRALWFDHAFENLPDTMQTAESAKVLGTAVMVGTGRGVLPKSMEGMVPAANMILLATRFYISRIQSLLYGIRTAADLGTGFAATPKATKAARQEVAKMYGRSVTGRALLLMLAAWGFGKSLGGDDEDDKGVVLDPFNPDFGRVKLGEKTKLDFMSGINGFSGVMLRVGFEKKTDPATGRTEVLSPTDLGREVTNFFASKRNLQISFLWNYHKGEFYGGKTANFENALEEATTAIIINDTVNAFKELGPVKGAALTMLMLTGAGASVGDAREEEAQRKAEKAAANLERKRREAALNQ